MRHYNPCTVDCHLPVTSFIPFTCVKLTEHGTKVTFATTCLHNGIIAAALVIRFILFAFFENDICAI